MRYFNQKLFWCLISIAIVLRLFLVFAIPTDQTIQFRLEGMNDEPSHYNYIKFLAKNHTFPIQTLTIKDSLAFITNEFEYYQPPAYYLLCAPFISIAGIKTGLYLCRIVSFLLGIATCALIAKILYRLNFHPTILSGAVVFAALLPTHAYFSAVVSNDSLCWFFSALLTLQLVNVSMLSSRNSSVRWSSALTTGLVLSAAMLTKSSMLVFFPVVAVCFFWQGYRNRSPVFYAQGAVILILTLIIAAPWYIRNLNLYGELFALNMGFGEPHPALQTVWSIVPLTRITIRFFWFPMQHLRTGTLPVIMLELVGILFILLHGYAVVLWLRKIRYISLPQSVVLGAFALSCLAYIKLHCTWFNSEARFLFTGLTGIVWLFFMPLVILPSKCRQYSLYLLWPVVLTGYPWLYLFFVTSS